MIPPDEDQEKIGRAAGAYAAYYGDIRRWLATEYGTDIRWLTASLFALNGGGLVALSGKKDLCLYDLVSGSSFLLGLCGAFGFVVYSQSKVKQFSHIIHKIEEKWLLVSTTGANLQAEILKLEKEKADLKTGLSNYFTGFAFAMFVTGLVSFAIGKSV